MMVLLNLAGYQTTDRLYAGNRTEVYRAIREADKQPVIIKVLRNPHPNFNELVQFRHQYVITCQVNSPHIVQPLALERYGNSYALVMPDLGAVSLAEYWQQSDRSLGEFLNIAIQLADALHDLSQQRIIHKDIKPANILICPATHEVKLIDFSISTLLPKEEQQLTNPNVLEGTLAYISPEQTGRMNRGIDYRSDFYSLGVTFYELLTGKLPFETDDAMELVHCHIAKMPILGNRHQPGTGNRERGTGNRHQPATNQEQIPQVLADIVLKLMAKNAEDRYQSALGLKHDLEKCWQQWESTGKIDGFKLGEIDRCDRFTIPEKLYGRETEIAQLLAAFERVANPPEFNKQEKVRGVEIMLVAGFSGIGKTAVIKEVHKPIIKQRGYFIQGKFDQFNRNIPFSAFVQAFRDLMGQLLGCSDAELTTWKTKILNAVGTQGQVIVEVIPELERIIGPQRWRVPELSGSAAQNRFNLLFSKFLRVFSAKEHPLVIFLDDLQWADSASLNLMKLLMEELGTGYLLILGAYRDNEVFPAHPLMLTLKEIQRQGAKIHTLTLAPLTETDITCLVADTLLCSREIAAPLSQSIYQKTQGNPFFTTQFLQGLHEDGWITFDPNALYWQCNIARVRGLALTDDVVVFMMERLQKLSRNTQELLKIAACIGNEFTLDTLAIVSEKSDVEVASDLWSALAEGLILAQNEIYKFYLGDRLETELGDIDSESYYQKSKINYKFLHDRVQQAAYCLIPEEQKRQKHYQIGQRLLATISSEEKQERIFELVNQLNYGMDFIADQKIRDELAALNLMACRKARAATAYQAGREYASSGLSVLGENGWARQYKMSLEFHELAAELAFLCGDLAAMEEFVASASARAKSLLDRVNIYRIKIIANISNKQPIEAIAIAQQILHQLGVDFPENPTQNDIQSAIAEINQLIGDREIADLVNLPLMTDREKIAIVQIATSIIPASDICGSPFYPLLVALPVKLSIQYGNTPASASAYVSYGILANRLHDVDTAVKFGDLALQAVSQLDAKAFKPEVLVVVGMFILHRKDYIRKTLPLLQEAYTAGLELGTLDFAGYAGSKFCFNSFWCGQPLAPLEQEIFTYYNGLLQLNQLTAANWCRISWQSTLNLLLNSQHPGILSGTAIQEDEFLPQMLEYHDLFGLYLFYLYKLMLCYLFEEIESAQSHALEVKRYFKAVPGTVAQPAFYLYDSLTALAQLHESSQESDRKLERVEENQIELQQWANDAPMNYQHKVDLVAAEKCRVLEQKLAAMELYDRAIAGAKENGFLQEEALGNELAAKFYLDWGKEKIAATYMIDAYYCYARWGAKAKTDQLSQKYPQLLAPILQKQAMEINQHNSTNQLDKFSHTLVSNTYTQSSTGLSDTLDVASLLQAAGVLSSQLELNPLLAEISRIILINAGAQKAVLLTLQDDQWQLRAIAQISSDGTIETNTQSQSLTPESPLPIRLIQYVKNTAETVLINEANTEINGIIEGYLLTYKPQSVLCVPLLNQGQLVAILYLEHLTSKGVFTPNRQTIVAFLCTQAAISLQNAQLYDRVQQALTDLQQAQLQLVQSEKMSALGNLVAGVAHEINNPVGFLQGNIQPAQEYVQDLLEMIDFLQKKCPRKEETEILDKFAELEIDLIREDFPELLGSMNQGVERIKSISQSLRIFSRQDREQKALFKIDEGIESTLLILKHRTKASEHRPAIQIIKDYQEIPEVPCFPGQLNQVFMNILANAVDAFDEANQGKTYCVIQENPNQIKISISQVNENQVQIQIQDNGCGMNPETKARIFEQGFTTKEVGKGTGLGMAIAHQIVTEKHGGTIECDSELGKGTTFTIALPISAS